jgi:hypothetical protein
MDYSINTSLSYERIKIWLISFMILIGSASLSAQARFTTQVNPNPVTEGQRFQISYTLNTEGRNFVPPSFGNDIQILSGPSTSSSTSIVNGRMSRQVSYTYLAVANKTGRFTIPGANISVGSERVKSEDVVILVMEPSAAEKRRRDEEEKRKEQLDSRAEQIIKDNLYVTVNVSKRKVYKGEQLVATYKLFMNADLNVVSLEPTTNPNLTGFWAQDFDQDMKNWTTERIDGAVFKTLVIKKVVLIPTRSGELTIDPIAYNSTVRLRTGRSRSRFDDFFGGGSFQDFQHTIGSPRVTITSLPLPDGAPESFAGAVGNFEMEAFFDKTELPADESLSLKINITGNGNLKLIEAPEVDFPPDFEVFDPKTADNVRVTTTGSKGNLQFEYLAIPRNAGTFNMKPVEFSYFDLSTKEYKTLTSEPFTLNITKGEGGGSQIFSSGKESIEILSSDINYLKSELGQTGNRNSFFGSFLFILLSILPLVGIIAFIILARRRKDKDDSYIESRKRTASKVARKRLQKSQSLMKAGDEENFYIEINRAMWGYLSEKLAIPVSDLTFSIAAIRLNEKGIEEGQIANAKSVIDESEMARYAPSAVSGSMDTIYSKAKDTITALEEGLK